MLSASITTRDPLPDNQSTIMPVNPFPVLQELVLCVDVLEVANNFITAVWSRLSNPDGQNRSLPYTIV
jgi:hypothetical protein